jgi:tetratricopeptide (TPR) repeat protein
MRAFIIRPFGVKKEIDFNATESLLIAPALERLNITGRTTIDILRQGNIRIDMFQRLVTADIVIADLSIHNANVFYELGIRHALQEKRTFMIRSNADEYPFDLQTDRYFTYDKADPGASLEDLVQALRQTLNSEEQDSPVFKLLPNLKVQDRSLFLIVPVDFREEVQRAVAAKQLADLNQLAEEVRGFEWETEALRVVGRAQFDLKAHSGARMTWEAIRNHHPDDLEANTKLGTVYQKLGDLTKSDQALKRALDCQDMERKDRAEAYALLGSNAKVQWRAEWRDLPPEQQREQALRSSYLEKALNAYTEAFNEDLNHYYSGINALAMLTVLHELSKSLPDIWAERFEDDAATQAELNSLEGRIKKLSGAVETSLEADKKRREREMRVDMWANLSEAELCCLTSKRPARVANSYRNALAGVPDFAVDSARNQLLIYQQVGVLAENVKQALSVFPTTDVAQKTDDAVKPQRVILFTGHRIDEPGRKKPRFPATQEKVAREKIKQAIEEEMKLPGDIAFGIAGGASGGDILFHEVCAELGIPTKLYLAMPVDQYIEKSVQQAGANWVERFRQLHERLQPQTRVLSDVAPAPEDESEYLPRWLRDKQGYTIWERNNLWMLHNALVNGGRNLTLIALWDGDPGDGAGGTMDLVQKVKARGAKPIIINTKELFAL